MENDLVNPKLYIAGHVKQRDPRFAGGKFYLAKLSGNGPLLVGRTEHKRASEAEKEAVEWRERLIAEYESKLAEMLSVEPTA